MKLLNIRIEYKKGSVKEYSRLHKIIQRSYTITVRDEIETKMKFHKIKEKNNKKKI